MTLSIYGGIEIVCRLGVNHFAVIFRLPVSFHCRWYSIIISFIIEDIAKIGQWFRKTMKCRYYVSAAFSHLGLQCPFTADDAVYIILLTLETLNGDRQKKRK